MADEVQETRETQTTDTGSGNTNVQRQTVTQRSSVSGGVVAQRVVWYIAGFLAVVIALRVVMLLLGANKGNGFVDFIYSFASVFVAPFEGIFGTASYGASHLDTAGLVAIAVYVLVGWGLAKLFALGNRS